MTATRELNGADRAEERRRMVAQQIEPWGVRDDKVLAAMRKVPREAFVPASEQPDAYADMPLPIGAGQTISQPLIVADMTEKLLLEGGERVLEIGTGSGYAAAILAEIAGEVYTVERIPMLAERARGVLHQQGYDRVTVICGDGTLGYAAAAPYDAILVTAGGPHVPETLKRQLRIGGRLVMPVGGHVYHQYLHRVTRLGEDAFREEVLEPVAFVPLIGREGWGENEAM
jgi:protein-L-isoaspartate(D-aspartate) O-methyltransferase